MVGSYCRLTGVIGVLLEALVANGKNWTQSRHKGLRNLDQREAQETILQCWPPTTSSYSTPVPSSAVCYNWQIRPQTAS